jgi:DNA-binding transcriptional regulator YiaG
MVTDKELYVATIARLLNDFGSYGTIANILNVSVDDLRQWSLGRARPPSGIFFRMLHLTES